MLSPSGAINYDQFASTYAANRRAVKRVVQHICEQVSARRPQRILEVGCGTANHLAAVSTALGAAGYGFDRSGGMLEEARRSYPWLHLSEGNAEERYPYDDAQFDLVFAVDMVHYLKELHPFLSEAHRVLRPGGACAVVTWSENDIRRSTIAEYFPDTVSVDVKRMPGVPRLESVMSQVGFASTRATHTEYTYLIDQQELERFRHKAYTELLLIGEAAFRQGLARLEADVSRGSGHFRELYSYVWGEKSR